MKVLAVDYGSKRVGLAVGDSLARIASPLELVASNRQQAVLDAILERVSEFEVERIVVGYPMNMDGSKGPACAVVDRFVGFLRKRVGVPVVLVDEKLSSVEAEELGKEIEGDFRKRRKFLDSLAAQVILRHYFEGSNGKRSAGNSSLKRFFLLLLLLVLAALAWFVSEAYRKVLSPFQGYAQNTVVLIESGMPVSAIGKKLQRQGVIASADYFTRYYRLFFAGKKLKAGEYLFDGPLSMRQVIEKLEEGKALLYKVTVKEGLWIGETAQIFEKAGLFTAAEFQRVAGDAALIRDIDPEADDLEGYLFPETYLVRRDITAREMARPDGRALPAEFQQHLHLARQGYRPEPAPGGDPGLADREGDSQPRRTLPGLLGVPQPPAAEHAPRLRLDHHLRPEKGRQLRRQPALGRSEERLTLQYPQAARPAAGTDRQPRRRLAGGGPLPGNQRLPVFRGQGQGPPLLLQEPGRAQPRRAEVHHPARRDGP